jgi:hypothetical protein
MNTADWSMTETARSSGGGGRRCHARVVEPCTFREGTAFLFDSSDSGCSTCATSTIECEEYK